MRHLRNAWRTANRRQQDQAFLAIDAVRASHASPREGWRHGRLRISGIGEMAARGEAPTPGRMLLSFVIECAPNRARGEASAQAMPGAGLRLAGRKPA